MVANTDPIFVDTANCAEVTFVNADGTTPKDLVSAGADGSKIFAINCTSDDTADPVYIDVFIHDGTSAYLLGRVPVATLSGTDGSAPSVNLLDPNYIAGLDADNELFLPTSYKVQVGPSAAVTSAKTVTMICFAGDY